MIGVKVWVYKGDTLGRGDSPGARMIDVPPDDERKPRGPRREPRDGARPGADRPPARVARRPAGANVAPADGSDKPAEAIGGAPTGTDATKPAVKRVRKVAAPGATTAADGKGE